LLLNVRWDKLSDDSYVCKKIIPRYGRKRLFACAQPSAERCLTLGASPTAKEGRAASGIAFLQSYEAFGVHLFPFGKNTPHPIRQSQKEKEHGIYKIVVSQNTAAVV